MVAPIRRHRRVGAKARARIRAGGPTSVHRAALPRAAWVALVAHVRKREGYRCLVCRRRGPLDPAHLKPRSLGGWDTPDNVVALCRKDHRDLDLHRGLTIECVGDGRFEILDSRG